MTLKERLEFCSICEKRHIDLKTGLVCKLTNEKPTFEDKCEDFTKDDLEAKRKLTLKLKATGNARTQNGSLSPKRNKLLGLILLIFGLVAIVFSFLFGGILIFTGISFIVKGLHQDKVLRENLQLEEKISQA